MLLRSQPLQYSSNRLIFWCKLLLIVANKYTTPANYYSVLFISSCSLIISSSNRMGRHKTVTCHLCTRAMRSDNLKRHLTACQLKKTSAVVYCLQCGAMFSKQNMARHLKNCRNESTLYEIVLKKYSTSSHIRHLFEHLQYSAALCATQMRDSQLLLLESIRKSVLGCFAENSIFFFQNTYTPKDGKSTLAKALMYFCHTQTLDVYELLGLCREFRWQIIYVRDLQNFDLIQLLLATASLPSVRHIVILDRQSIQCYDSTFFKNLKDGVLCSSVPEVPAFYLRRPFYILCLDDCSRIDKSDLSYRLL